MMDIMKKTIALCALTCVLAYGTSKQTYAQKNNLPNQNKETTTQRYCTILSPNKSYYLFSVKEGHTINFSDFGTLKHKQIYQNAEGELQPMSTKFYDFNGDGVIDFFVSKNNDLKTIGFSSNSENYEQMKEKLNDKIIPLEQYNLNNK